MTFHEVLGLLVEEGGGFFTRAEIDTFRRFWEAGYKHALKEAGISEIQLSLIPTSEHADHTFTVTTQEYL